MGNYQATQIYQKQYTVVFKVKILVLLNPWRQRVGPTAGVEGVDPLPLVVLKQLLLGLKP